jgi:hypothetical protein
VKKSSGIVPVQHIERTIVFTRGEKAILDADLAILYGTTAKALNQPVKRNRQRIPRGFMFRLTTPERDGVVTNCYHPQRLRFFPNLPYAFIEYGAIMAVAFLNTPRAIEVSVFVVRAFVKMREVLTTHGRLARKTPHGLGREGEACRRPEGHSALPMLAWARERKAAETRILCW